MRMTKKAKAKQTCRVESMRATIGWLSLLSLPRKSFDLMKASWRDLKALTSLWTMAAEGSGMAAKSNGWMGTSSKETLLAWVS